jgi:hypothetical protein
MLPVSTLDADLKVRVGGYIFAPRENALVVSSAFTSLQEMTGPGWNPQTFVTDFKFSPGCLQEVFGEHINFVGCMWHFHHDLPKHIKGYCVILLYYFLLPSFVRYNASTTIDHIVRKVIGARSIEAAEAAFTELEVMNPKAHAYFKRTWWPEKERLLQVHTRDSFTLNYHSNSIAESTNSAIKTLFIRVAETTTLSELITDLLDKDTADFADEATRHAHHEIHHQQELFSQNFMKLQETIRAAAEGYVVKLIDQSELLEGEEAAYSVIHEKSKSAAHRVFKLAGQQLFACSCKEDKTSGYPDRHLQALAVHLQQPLDLRLYVHSRWRYPKELQAPVCNMIN